MKAIIGLIMRFDGAAPGTATFLVAIDVDIFDH
ncbi:hypothetical protein ABH944_002294 [Caballeronia udeis]|uniref:Uncharacterized protein n=1 Tax=Caballeronia udeis TaxID=1232866 RepID=A0ABW8N0V2_9BURK